MDGARGPQEVCEWGATSGEGQSQPGHWNLPIIDTCWPFRSAFHSVPQSGGISRAAEISVTRLSHFISTLSFSEDAESR